MCLRRGQCSREVIQQIETGGNPGDDCLGIVEPQAHPVAVRQRLVGGDRLDRGIVWPERLLAGKAGDGRTLHFQTREGVAREAFDQHQLDRLQSCEQGCEVGRGSVAAFVQQGPARLAGQQHLMRAGLAVQPAILAGLVQVDAVMGVLDGGDTYPMRAQPGDQGGDQGGLAAAGPSDDTEDRMRKTGDGRQGADFGAATPTWRKPAAR